MILQGDCLQLMRQLPASSIDLVLTDPPYGTTAISWDTQPDLRAMWTELKRVGKDTCIYVFTAAQPFTSELVMSNKDWFKYEWIYEKTNAKAFQSAQYRPLAAHESIIVFSKLKGTYNPQMWNCPPEYVNKRKSFTIREMGEAYGGGTTPRKQESTVKYPRTVIPVSNHTPRSGLFHPTQKPVSLMAYLVRTYTNEGDIVFDPYAGSGSTLLAAKQEGREFIGMEIDPRYIEVINNRLAQGVLL